MIVQSRRLSAFPGLFHGDGAGDSQQLDFIWEIENDENFLCPFAAGFIWSVNDDLLDELVHDGGCQFRDVCI